MIDDSNPGYGWRPEVKDRKPCRMCNSEVTPESKRRFYCSKRCADKSKKVLDRKRGIRIRTEKDSFKRQKKMGCKCHTRPAWPHAFDENMVCRECGLSWESNQIPHPEAVGGFHHCTLQGEARAIQATEDRKKRDIKKRARKILEAMSNIKQRIFQELK